MAASGESALRSTHSHPVGEASKPGLDETTPVSFADTLRLFTGEGGMRTFKVWLYKLFCDRSGFHPVRSLLALKAEILWSHGDHSGVRHVAGELASRHRCTLGYYFLAQSAHVRGETASALDWLAKLLQANPDHTDGIYLKARCLAESGGREGAWKALESLALRKKRAKTWQQLANLVETPEDLRDLLGIHRKAVAKGVIPEFSREVSNHLSVAAMRGGDHALAKSLWKEILGKALDKPSHFAGRRPKVDVYCRKRAETALSDLRSALGAASIEMFLISGTLLGCIREGRLLGHDKDIDVGIWNTVDSDALTAAIRASGSFQFIVSRSPHITRVRHLNGIPIDLFRHHREADDCWHASSKIIWHNSPFSLTETRFLGESYLVPADHDTYLRENYGDWRTPKTDFDSAFDTPNGELVQKDELVVHCLKMLFSAASANRSSKIAYYLGKLRGLDEAKFADEFQARYRGNSARP